MRKALRAGTSAVEIFVHPGPGVDRLRFLDVLDAVRFLRRFASEESNLTKLRALLAERFSDHGVLRRSDEEVIEAAARHLVSGRLGVVVRRPHPLVGFGDEVAELPPTALRAEAREDKTWIEIVLLDLAGAPMGGERYWIALTDGSFREGRLDGAGKARFDGIPPGDCDIRFPDIDEAVLSSSTKTTGTPRGRSWIELALLDPDGKPVPDERYWIQLPDGAVREGRLDASGKARVEGIAPGECEVRFPDTDERAVSRISAA